MSIFQRNLFKCINRQFFSERRPNTFTMPDSMLALVERNGKDGKPVLSKEKINKPQPQAHQIVVKISHAAQNPTDGETTRHLMDINC